MSFAKKTTVPVAKTKVAIEELLRKHKASSVLAGERFGEAAFVAFTIKGRNVRLDIPLPKRRDFRSETQLEQALRSRWRVFLLLLKAKLESIELGYTSVEAEFLHAIMLPSGSTFGEKIASGEADALLGDGSTPLLPPWGG